MNPTSLPQLILFDWDNTLIDSSFSTFLAINETLKTFGKEVLSVETFSNQPSLSIRTYFASIFSPAQFKQAESFFSHRIRSTPVTPLEHTRELLEWIKLLNIPMGVVSNKEGDMLREEIRQLAWQHYFYCAIGSYDTEEDKPSPVPLLHALTLGSMAAGSHVWFVGDSIVDMVCAHRAACIPVSVGIQANLHKGPMIRATNGRGVHQLLQRLHLERSSS